MEEPFHLGTFVSDWRRPQKPCLHGVKTEFNREINGAQGSSTAVQLSHQVLQSVSYPQTPCCHQTVWPSAPVLTALLYSRSHLKKHMQVHESAHTQHFFKIIIIIIIILHLLYLHVFTDGL